MSEAHKMSPDEYTDEEMLETVHARTRHGYGAVRIDVHAHTMTEREERIRQRKVPRVGTHSAQLRPLSSRVIRQRKTFLYEYSRDNRVGS